MAGTFLDEFNEVLPREEDAAGLAEGSANRLPLEGPAPRLHFKGVEVDIKLGLSPKLNVAFLQ